MKQSVYDWLYKSNLEKENDKWLYKENKTAKIEIYNFDKQIIQITDESNNIKFSYSEDCKKENGESYVSIDIPISKEYENYNISFKAKGNGKIQIRLTGPEDKKNEYNFCPILVDFKDFYVNEKRLDMPIETLWYKISYDTPIYDIKDGQTFTFSISAKQHYFKLNDFKLIIQTFKKWELSSIYYLIGTILVVMSLFLLIYLKNFRQRFCLIIFLFLIIPFLFISKEDVSKQEKRTLNKFPSIFLDNGKINEKFGIEFDDWFSDRFGGRQALIKSRFKLLYRINNRTANERAFLADDGWIFPTKGIKYIPSTEGQLNKIINIAAMLKKIDNYFYGKDIQIYIILEPSRSTIYQKYWKNYYPFIAHIDYCKQLKEDLKEHPNIHFIELENIFEENKDKIQLYEKNDPHMTLPAVNIMLEEIILAIDKNMPEKDLFKTYKKSIKYKERSCKLFSFLNLYDDYLKRLPEKEDTTCQEITIAKSNMKIIEKEIGMREAVVSKPYIDKELYILFLCYEEFIFPVLGEFFAHTISVNYNAFEKHDKEALREKALSKLKSVKPETTVLIFLSYPTEDDISKSTNYLEAF